MCSESIRFVSGMLDSVRSVLYVVRVYSRCLVVSWSLFFSVNQLPEPVISVCGSSEPFCLVSGLPNLLVLNRVVQSLVLLSVGCQILLALSVD